MEVNLLEECHAPLLLLLPTGEILPDSKLSPVAATGSCNQLFYFWQMASMVLGIIVVMLSHMHFSSHLTIAVDGFCP